SYLFRDFLPLYDSLRHSSDFIDRWLERKGGVRTLDEYFRFIETARTHDFGLRLRFGLEICFLPEQIDAIGRRICHTPLDFTVGSVHFIDHFAFDHRPDLWQGVDVDDAYRRFFALSAALVESGLFDGLAHPDSIKLFGHTPSYPLDEDCDSLAAALAGTGMYAEQNSGVARRTDAERGMSSVLYAAMKRHHVPIRTASDAHHPRDVGEGIRYFYDNHLI
ncbi:MAG: histidinol phosphate phosphatase, partial [Eubacteriales bacterium]